MELIDENTFEELKAMIENKEKENLENKEKRTLNKADYLYRAKREVEITNVIIYQLMDSWKNHGKVTKSMSSK